jgi:hypothetical protein
LQNINSVLFANNVDDLLSYPNPTTTPEAHKAMRMMYLWLPLETLK